MQLGYVCVTMYARWEGTGISSRFLRLRGVNVGKGCIKGRRWKDGERRLHDDDRAVFAWHPASLP